MCGIKKSSVVVGIMSWYRFRSDCHMNKRLKWAELQEKYPDQWVGLTDVERDGVTVVSAIVKYADKTRSELTMIQLDDSSLYSCYTCPDHLAPLGNGRLWYMIEFTLDLYSNIQRPVIFLEDWHKFDAMLDTGALFPVWVEEERALSKIG